MPGGWGHARAGGWGHVVTVRVPDLDDPSSADARGDIDTCEAWYRGSARRDRRARVRRRDRGRVRRRGQRIDVAISGDVAAGLCSAAFDRAGHPVARAARSGPAPQVHPVGPSRLRRSARRAAAAEPSWVRWRRRAAERAHRDAGGGGSSRLRGRRSRRRATEGSARGRSEGRCVGRGGVRGPAVLELLRARPGRLRPGWHQAGHRLVAHRSERHCVRHPPARRHRARHVHRSEARVLDRHVERCGDDDHSRVRDRRKTRGDRRSFGRQPHREVPEGRRCSRCWRSTATPTEPRRTRGTV